MKNSIKVKVSLGFGSLSLILGILFGVIFTQYSANSLYSVVDAELEARGISIYGNGQETNELSYQPKIGSQPILVNYVDVTGNHVDKLPSNVNDTLEEVARKNKIFISVDKLELSQEIIKFINYSKGVSKYFDLKLNENYWRVLVIKDIHSGGALILARNTTEQKESIEGIQSSIIFLTFFVFIISLLLGYYIANKSLINLTNFIKNISKLDPKTNERLPEINLYSKDETSQLELHFNQLINKINILKSEDEQLIANITHEIKTPLTSLITNASLLSENLSKKDMSEVSEAIISEAKELNDIIDSLTMLNISNDTWQHIKFRNFVNDIAEQWAKRKMVVSSIGEGEFLSNDKILKIVINNLIENAFKFTKSPKVLITLLSSESDEVVFEFRDYGPGVPEEHLSEIFKRFYRPIESQSTNGSGLGLSVVKQLIEKLNGTIEARNDNGLVFTIKIKNRAT